MFQLQVKAAVIFPQTEIFAQEGSPNAHIVRGEKTASTLVEALFVCPFQLQFDLSYGMVEWE